MTAQQLKNAILQEAIEGRLVPQDPNDEPASILLERIRAEKERLVKEGKLKKKDLEVKPISEDEIPFEIPESWEWCRVSDISESYIGLTYKPSDVSNNGWVVLRSSNIQYGNLDFSDIVRVNVDVPEKLHVQENDIIICARNGSKKLVGKSALVREITEQMTFGAFMALCRSPFYSYMSKYLLSPLFFEQLRKESDTTTINQLTQKNFNKYLVPLPPLAEQKRIVAKIEELLPKVEKYGKAQEELNKLNEGLPERLRKSFLQEAIEGRLVPQDPNDEPASVLLDKIREEKKQLVKEGKLKKKDLEEIPISEDEIPFEIPDSWEWVKLGVICELISGRSYTETDTGALYIKVSDMNLKENMNEIRVSSHFCKCKEADYVPNNSIIFPKRGGAIMTGKKRMVKSAKICIDLNTMALHPYYEPLFPYLCIWFNYIDLGKLTDGSAVPQINNKDIAPLFFPLPPLAEQKRIVEKIEQLLKEIDKLK